MRWLLVLVLWASSALAGDVVSVELREIPLSEFVRVVYGDVLHRSFVLDAAIVADRQLVSVNLQAKDSVDIAAQADKLLSRHGYVSETVGGLTSVSKRSADAPPEGDVWIYRPEFRSASYLLDVVSGFFKQGAFSVQRGGSSGGGDAVQLSQVSGGAPVSPAVADKGGNAPLTRDADVIAFRGTSQEIRRLKTLIAQLDIAVPEVLVKAVVFEVTSTKREGSAVDLAMSILSAKLGIDVSLGAGPDTGGTYLKFHGAGLDVSAVYRALASDDRFKVATSPRLRVRSGGSARFSVGNETPVLGQVSYDDKGHPVQSVNYRPSGVIFEVKPIVRAGGAQLQLSQQISQFAATTTGVNGSPTLTKRELLTDVTARDGELIVLGGLDESSDSGTLSRIPFLPRFMDSSNKEERKTELVLMLQVQQI